MIFKTKYMQYNIDFLLMTILFFSKSVFHNFFFYIYVVFFDHNLLLDLIVYLSGSPFQDYTSYFHVCGLLYSIRISYEYQALYAEHIDFSK